MSNIPESTRAGVDSVANDYDSCKCAQSYFVLYRLSG